MKTTVVGALIGALGVVAAAAPATAQSGWSQEVWSGLTGIENYEVQSMAVYNGSLFAGTWNNQGGEVWARGYSPPFLVWFQSNTDGFGDPNNTEIESMAEFTGFFTALYAGTYNSTTGCEIWYDDPTFGWSQTGGSGLGDPYNYGASAMAVFGGSLYVGTINGNGLQIHRYTGVTWAPPVVTGGFGDVNNTSVLSMSVEGAYLYASTFNGVNGPDIWYTTNGTNWYIHWQGGPSNSTRCDAILAHAGVVIAAYDGPNGVRVYSVGPMIVIQLNTDGFGDANNWRATSIVEYKGKVYVATENYVTGGEVWRMDAPGVWHQVNVDGFGDPDNDGATALTVLGEELFAGTNTAGEGAEVWRYDLLFEDGFESGDLFAWSALSP